MGINSRFLNLDTDVTLASNSDEIIPSQKAIKTYIDTKDSNVVHKTGDETIAGTKTFTTKITSPIIETGTDANNYFQSQKFRGQGDASTYQHAIDFGYAYHDQMDFYEYGGKYVFHKHTGVAIDSGDTILGQITTNGWEGSVKGDLQGDNYVKWGGPNLSGAISPCDAGCVDDHGHNKASYYKGTVKVEYTTDGGTTWTELSITDANIFGLLTKGGYAVKIGNVSSSGVITSENCENYKARITLGSRNSSGSGVFYTAMRKLLLNVSTNGASGTNVKIETRTIANYNNNVDSWTDRGTYPVSGWSGWNSIPCGITFGGGTTQTSQMADLRITLGITGVSSGAANANISDIRIIGTTNWSVDSFASTGHLYNFDKDKNVTFPAKVIATGGFSGNLTGNVTGNVTGTASKATADASGNTITTTYATKTEVNEKVEYAMVIKEW